MRRLLICAVLACAAPAQSPEPRPDPVLEGARSWALNYTRKLPDFFCTEFIRRYWQDNEVKLDTLTLQLGFSHQRATYTLVARNNRPSHQTLQSLNGAFSSGEFGSALFLAFDPASAAIFQPEQPSRIRRVKVAVYGFAVPLATSHYRLQYAAREIMVPYHGRVYIDPASGRVLRLSMEIDPPADFGIQKTSTILDYDWRDIAGTPYFLPVRADVRTVERFRERPLRYHNIVEFRDYHKYAIDSKIGFDPQ